MLTSTTLLVAGCVVRIRYGPKQPDEPSLPPLDLTGAAGMAGDLLNAAAGAWLRASPLGLATLWFPAADRGLAIALAFSAWAFGQGGSHFVTSAFVPWAFSMSNSSGISRNVSLSESISETFEYVEDVAGRNPLQTLAIVHYVAAIAALIAVLVYFPSRPPMPPAANEARSPPAGFKGKIKRFAADLSLCLLILAYALPSAANMAVREEILGDHDHSLWHPALASTSLMPLLACLLCFLLDRAKTRATMVAVYALAACAFGAVVVLRGASAERGAFMGGAAVSFAGTALAADLVGRRAVLRGGARFSAAAGAVLVLVEHVLLCLWWSVKLTVGQFSSTPTFASAAAFNGVAAILAILASSDKE